MLVSRLCLNTLSELECVGVDISETNGVDSSSLLSSVVGSTGVLPPSRRSFNLLNVPIPQVGTGIEIIFGSSLSEVIESLDLKVDELAFAKASRLAKLSSLDCDLSAGLGDDGGDINNEFGLPVGLLFCSL